MNLWISYPSVYIPLPSGDIEQESEKKTDPFYDRLLSAFSLPRGNETSQGKSRADAEELIAHACQSLLHTYATTRQPTLFIDCRSSLPKINLPAPTYKAVLQIGLTGLIPLSMSGQGGCEFGMALFLLPPLMRNQHRMALLSAAQRMVVSRYGENARQPILADASAAVLISYDIPLSPGLRLLAAGMGHIVSSADTIQQDVEQLWRTTIHPTLLPVNMTSDVIVHSGSTTLLAIVKELAPDARCFADHSNPIIDFGCVDVLISLHHYLMQKLLLQRSELLALWLGGQYGDISLLVFSVDV